MKALLSLILKLPRLLEFMLFYLKEVLISNLKVACEVLTPGHQMKPDLIYISVDGLTDRQMLVLANLVTMTPGTLSLDIEQKSQRLVVHSMYVDDPKADAKTIEDHYITRIRHVF